MLEQTSNLSTILDFLLRYILVPLAAAIVGGVGGGAIAYRRAKKRFSVKKEDRLFANIQRPVALIPAENDPLDLEKRLLESIEFFNIDSLTADARNLDSITSKYRMAIIRYEDTDRFWRIFESLADRTIPMVIYSKPAEIKTDQLIRIQNYYTRYTLCNTPVRLVSDVFAIMSVYPEGDI
jgi:hypothetical protein